MRIDNMEGTTVVYELECQWPKTAHQYYRGRWFKPEHHPSDFGEQTARYGENWANVCPLYKAVCASGEAWQKTGINGFLDRDAAILAFSKITLNKPDKAWRLVQRTYTLNTVVLLSMPATGEVTA